MGDTCQRWPTCVYHETCQQLLHWTTTIWHRSCRYERWEYYWSSWCFSRGIHHRDHRSRDSRQVLPLENEGVGTKNSRNGAFLQPSRWWLRDEDERRWDGPDC